jgi:hypothetical protein
LIECSFDVIFIVEVLIPWAVCPNHCGFLQSPYNWLDLAVAGPLVFRVMIYFTMTEENSTSLERFLVDLFLFCFVPILRQLKALRMFPNLALVSHALSKSKEALEVPLFFLLLLVLVFSTALYAAEDRENITGMPHAMWFVIVSVTTVGYGDTIPRTWMGRTIGAWLAVIGVMYMAMPLTIVGQAFNDTWKRRDHIILLERLRQRVRQWGYTETDLYAMFKRYDLDGSEDLDQMEFNIMAKDMRLGLSESAVSKLFNLFDEDGGGTIDYNELLEGIFHHEEM